MRIRTLSPFTIFWWIFYTVAIIGLVVPDRMAKWFAFAVAAPGVILVAVIMLALVIAGAELVLKVGANLLKRWGPP